MVQRKIVLSYTFDTVAELEEHLNGHLKGAASAPKTNPATTKGEQLPKVRVSDPEPVAPTFTPEAKVEAAPPSTVSRNQALEAIKDCLKRKGDKAVRDILAELGATSFSAVKKDQYPKLLELCQ